jgi:hypothetical protein
MCPGEAKALFAGVRSPPLRGGAGQGEVTFGGEREDNAEGGFLGGARSPRPCGKAVRKPRHNTIIGGKRTPGGLAGRSLAPSEASFAGVQSPPFRHGVHGRQTTSRGTSQSPRDAVL